MKKNSVFPFFLLVIYLSIVVLLVIAICVTCVPKGSPISDSTLKDGREIRQWAIPKDASFVTYLFRDGTGTLALAARGDSTLLVVMEEVREYVERSTRGEFMYYVDRYAARYEQGFPVDIRELFHPIVLKLEAIDTSKEHFGMDSFAVDPATMYEESGVRFRGCVITAFVLSVDHETYDAGEGGFHVALSGWDSNPWILSYIPPEEK